MSELINKAYKSYGGLSRYESVPYYYDTVNSRYVYGVGTQLDDTTASVSYTTNIGDTLDSIALKSYNNPTYFWIIADYNRILDCYKPLPVGIEIKIPNISSIKFNG